VAGASSPNGDAAAGRTDVAMRAPPGLTNGGRSEADALTLADTVTSPLADRADRALVLSPAVERVAKADCWRLVVVLGPPILRGSSSPSARCESLTVDQPLLPGRLTLGTALSSSSHCDPCSARSSAPAALPCGRRGWGKEGGEGAPELVCEAVRGEFGWVR